MVTTSNTAVTTDTDIPPVTKELIATAAMLCCDRGLDPIVAIEQASKIRGVAIQSPETFLCEYARELSHAVNALLQTRWDALKRTAKLKTAAALQSLFRAGAIERAFIDLVEGLASDDPVVRERAAKQVRDIAMKLASDKDTALSGTFGAKAKQADETETSIKQKVKFFISEDGT